MTSRKDQDELVSGARIAGLKKATTATKANRKSANEADTDLAPIIRQLHQAGKSQRQIADELNAQGHATRRPDRGCDRPGIPDSACRKSRTA